MSWKCERKERLGVLYYMVSSSPVDYNVIEDTWRGQSGCGVAISPGIGVGSRSVCHFLSVCIDWLQEDRI